MLIQIELVLPFFRLHRMFDYFFRADDFRQALFYANNRIQIIPIYIQRPFFLSHRKKNIYFQQ